MEAAKRIKSGAKYRTANGTVAIRDGIKAVSPKIEVVDVTERKPEWLRVRLSHDPRYRKTHQIVRRNNLSTVCEESHCPNIGECWSHGTATIMVLGAVCTRACRFCAVDTGNPHGWIDPEEPGNVARAVKLMNLTYVVLTSVDRDDLDDGGAGHYAACVREIKQSNPKTTVEALTPDFQGKPESIRSVVTSGLDVFAQNLETVERLTHEVRDPRAGYDQTLGVLQLAKQIGGVPTKSSLMLGLGESDAEIRSAMRDLRSHDVDFLTLGQYLRPTRNHLPVKRWVTPDDFSKYRDWGLEEGFVDVASGPLVRSSYRADQLIQPHIA